MITAATIYEVGSLAIQGVQEAVELWPTLKEVANGAVPTEAQWQSLVSLLGADHAALQAATVPAAP